MRVNHGSRVSGERLLAKKNAGDIMSYPQLLQRPKNFYSCAPSADASAGDSGDEGSSTSPPTSPSPSAAGAAASSGSFRGGTACLVRYKGKGGGGRGAQFVHGRSRMIIDPRIPTIPGGGTRGRGGAKVAVGRVRGETVCQVRDTGRGRGAKVVGGRGGAWRGVLIC